MPPMRQRRPDWPPRWRDWAKMALTLATIQPGAAEIFAAIQGEGLSAGRPSVFVRLSRCNLACHWCDTAYTWHFEGDNRAHKDGLAFTRTENQVTLDETEVAARIHAIGQDMPTRRLVITGGEPLLQGAALARMLTQLRAMHDGWHVEVETNGTVAPHPALDPLVHQYNVSPKLAHSGNPADLALIPERLDAWAQDPRATFKFVIAAPQDAEQVHALAAVHTIPPHRIYLMPEGRDGPTLHTRLRWLAEICLTHGYALTDRLHIHLSGDTRGT